MAATEQLKEDLSFVAGTVRRADGGNGVAAIYYLWAILVPIGWCLPDFAPQWAGWYWLVVGPAGGLLSAWLGVRADRERGVRDRKLGLDYAWHWVMAALGFIAVMCPVLVGTLTPAQAAPYMLLVAALAYGMAGVLEPPLRWTGLLMLAGFAVLTLARLPYVWTIAGLLVGVALLHSGVRARR